MTFRWLKVLEKGLGLFLVFIVHIFLRRSVGLGKVYSLYLDFLNDVLDKNIGELAES